MSNSQPTTTQPKLLTEASWNDGTVISDETTIGLVARGFWLLGIHFKNQPPITRGRPATWRLSLLILNVAFTLFTE